MSTTMLHVRVDEETKADAEAAFQAMGLTLSEGVRLFLRRVVANQAIPFPVEVPNAITRAAMQEARRLGATRFSNPDDLFDVLAAEGK